MQQDASLVVKFLPKIGLDLSKSVRILSLSLSKLCQSGIHVKNTSLSPCASEPDVSYVNM